jgi:hypothetical protein
VRAVYEKEHLGKVDQETLALRLGSTSLNGRALSRISALRKYGLLNGTGDELYVTKDAVIIIADPVESPERRAAISRAAQRPALFAKLFKRYPEKAPSEEALRSYLMKEKFTAGGVRKAAKAFLATMDIVTHEGAGYYLTEESGLEDDEMAQTQPAAIQGRGAQTLPAFQQRAEAAAIQGRGAQTLPALQQRAEASVEHMFQQRSKVKLGMKEDIFTLKEGDVVLQWPEAISPESYEDLESWAKLVLRKIQRHITIHTELPEIEDDEASNH